MGTLSKIAFGLVASNSIKVGAYGAVEGDAVALGYLSGSLEIEHGEESKDVRVDQVIGIIKKHTIDETMKIRITAAEVSLENLAIAFGYPTSAVSGGNTLNIGGKTSNTYRTVYVNVNGGDGITRKFTFHKCKPTGASTHSYGRENETVADMEFEVIVDTTKTAEQQFATVVDSGADTTPPTVVLTTPADGGEVAKDAKTTVLWTFTETNLMDANTIIYGDTVLIMNTTTPASTVLVAGSIAYDTSAKTITFTPTDNWTGEDTLQAIVTTGVKDQNGNAMAATKIEQFDVAA